MKLILTQEVAGLGSPGDVVTVADGYGRNYLVPRRFAIVATKGAERQVATIKRARDAREIRDLGHAQDVAGRLGGLSVRISVRAGREGRLFGSVTAADVATAITTAGGPVLDRRRIELDSPIKSVGAHRVVVHLHPEVTVTLTVNVVPA